MKDLVISSAHELWLYRGGKWINILDDYNIDALERKLFYGLTWSDERVFLGCSKEFLSLHSEVGFSKIVPLPAKNTHQFHWNGYDLLVALNHEDKVLKINPAKPNKFVKSELLDPKGYHTYINSVFYSNDTETYYCVAHGLGKPSLIIELDERLNVLDVYDNLESTEVHNVYYEDGLLYFLHSEGEEFIIYDTKSRKVVHKTNMTKVISGKQKKYLRGFARSKDGFYIGAAFDAGKDNRDDFKCKIVHSDNDFDKMSEIELPHSGQIREVRLFSDDLAHNGIKFPLEKYQ